MEFINKNPKIYILSGKAESGKNVVASIIKDYFVKCNLKCVVVSYASYLKEYAKEILGWDGNEDTKPRDFLQQIGVELIKNQINSNMLINRIVEDIKVYSYFFDVIIISDARFVDEIEDVKKYNKSVTVIKINGKDNNLNVVQKNHITETALDDYDNYDYVINNNGSLNELVKKVESFLEVK